MLHMKPLRGDPNVPERLISPCAASRLELRLIKTRFRAHVSRLRGVITLPPAGAVLRFSELGARNRLLNGRSKQFVESPTTGT